MGKQVAGFESRTCPVTRYVVDLASERLIIVNAVSAIVFLLIGGIIALLLALTRWQAIHLLPSVWYYRLVTAHGISMLVAWIVFFEVAGLYFGSTVMLNARHVSPGLGWVAWVLMAVGGLMAAFAVLLGPLVGLEPSDVMFTAYVPLKAHPLFYLGVVLFAVGALIAVGLFFANLVVARRERRYEGSLPLVVYGLLTAAIIATYTLLQGAIAFVPALLWSLNLLPSYDPAVYRNFFWGFGHPAQQINLAAMVAVWYALASITTGAAPLNEKLSRLAFILYLFFINLGSAHHLLVDPGPGFVWKVFNTSYGMYLAVLGSLIHAFSIPAALEVALRKKGFNRGLFEWLRKGPWREPGFAALVISMFIFGWIGGVTGVTMGTEQINMIQHNTLRVPGHFHATVVSGTTIAFMGLTYYLIPLIFRRELKFKNLATWQPYIYGAGMVLVSLGMITAGIQGVPRRHWDIGFALAGGPSVFPGTVNLSLAVLGLGAIIAVTGGAMFMIVVLSSVLFGTKREASSLMLVATDREPTLIAAVEDDHPAPRGAFALVIIFLIYFVTFYLANWWLLGRAWGVG